MTIRVDIWSDVNCPWCYIGKRRFEQGLELFRSGDEGAPEVEVTWHAYVLDPDLPDRYAGSEADYLAERKGMPAEQVAQMLRQVTEVAADLGLDYDFDALVPAQSLKAHSLAKEAVLRGADAGEVEETLFSAHFVEGRALSEPAVLRDLGARFGLDAAAVDAAVESETIAGLVEDDLATARRLGISGVPFFVFEQKYGVSGAQPAEVFAQTLETVAREVRDQESSRDESPGDRGAAPS
ncbi:DsbA family oxidoreductase [Brevibacterium litoralis]|uniref:DsbA family oxidoreductase n=1 Tax=Brevibacterium litoralis TaxID=3138935 RepID=UPI0032EBC547